MNGCNRKCPCREWVSCLYYVDIQKQQQRLKKKQENPEIHEYYNTYIRIEERLSEVMFNG